MAIRFACCDCQARLRVPEGSAGKKVRCPRCGTSQRIPETSQDTPQARAMAPAGVQAHRHVAAPDHKTLDAEATTLIEPQPASSPPKQAASSADAPAEPDSSVVPPTQTSAPAASEPTSGIRSSLCVTDASAEPASDDAAQVAAVPNSAPDMAAMGVEASSPAGAVEASDAPPDDEAAELPPTAVCEPTASVAPASDRPRETQGHGLEQSEPPRLPAVGAAMVAPPAAVSIAARDPAPLAAPVAPAPIPLGRSTAAAPPGAGAAVIGSYPGLGLCAGLLVAMGVVVLLLGVGTSVYIVARSLGAGAGLAWDSVMTGVLTLAFGAGLVAGGVACSALRDVARRGAG